MPSKRLERKKSRTREAIEAAALEAFAPEGSGQSGRTAFVAAMRGLFLSA
jgi:hypothetical protein